MKKFLMMMAMAMMTSMSMNAQTAGECNFIARAGGNLTTLTNNKDAKQRIGWDIGAAFNLCITDQFAVALDISHDYLGAKSKILDKNLQLEYLSFGPMAKYYATPWLALQAGPEIGFLLTAKLGGDKVVSGDKIKDAYKKTELSLPIGVSFEPKVGTKGGTLVLDLRYHLGLTKVNKNGDANRNSAFIFTAGYKFDLF
jgi:hypothetical protein